MGQLEHIGLRRLLLRGARQFVGESKWLYGSLLVGRVLGVANLFVFVRHLAFEDFASYSIIVAYVTLVSSLLDFRAFEAVIQFVQGAHLDGEPGRARAFLRHCYRYDVGTGIVATVVIVVTAPVAAAVLLDNANMAGLVVIYGLAPLAVTANTTCTAVFRIFGRFASLGRREILGMVLRRSATITTAITTHSLAAVMAAEVVGSTLHALSLNVGARRLANTELLGVTSGLLPLNDHDRRRLRRFLFGTNVFGSLKLVVGQADILLVGVLVGKTSAGFYRIAKAGAEFHQAVIAPLHTIFHPRIARAAQQGPAVTRLVARSATLAAAAVAVPIGLVLFAAAPLVMNKLGGADTFRVAADYLRIMLIGTTISGILFWPGSVLMAHEDIWVVNIHTAIRSAFALIALVAALPLWGPTAASAIYAAWLSTAVLASLGIARRRGYLDAGSPSKRLDDALAGVPRAR